MLESALPRLNSLLGLLAMVFLAGLTGDDWWHHRLLNDRLYRWNHRVILGNTA